MPEFDAGAYLDAIAPLIGITIADHHRAGVIENLERIAAMAALVAAFPLPDQGEPGQEPAPVFRP